MYFSTLSFNHLNWTHDQSCALFGRQAGEFVFINHHLMCFLSYVKNVVIITLEGPTVYLEKSHPIIFDRILIIYENICL
jgi:hypothetical protein